MTSGAVSVRGLRKVYPAAPPSGHLPWAEVLGKRIRALLKKREMKVALDDLTLEVRPGELFGIVGANGAGKTTLLKLLSCLLYPDGGDAEVNGFDIRRHRSQVRRTVVVIKAQGWLSTLWQLTGRENLMFRARMAGLAKHEATDRVSRALRFLEVEHRADDYSFNWSMGEMQKISLALSFVIRPPVVFFDEPTAHLDPHAANLVRSFIREQINRANGQTVIMSTHYLEEAEALCDRVAILASGRLLACGSPAQLKAAYAPAHVPELWVEEYAPGVGEKLKDTARLLERFEDAVSGKARLRVYGSVDVATVVRRLEDEGVRIVEVRETEATLDDVFFCILEEERRRSEGGAA